LIIDAQLIHLSCSRFKAGPLRRFIPLFDRVLVQRAEAALKTKGGIVIPEKSQSKVLEGVVVAAGPGNPIFHLFHEF